MSGRRSYPRAVFADSDGVLSVSHDVVIVSKRGHDEFVVLSDRSLSLAAVVTIAFGGTSDRENATVRIIARRVVVVDGAVKHELRLARLDAPLLTEE